MRRQWKPVRVALDANVLVSALISGAGPPGQLLSAVKRGDLALVTSGYQIEELREVLGSEKLRPHIKPEEARDLIDNLETIGSLIHELPECEPGAKNCNATQAGRPAARSQGSTSFPSHAKHLPLCSRVRFSSTSSIFRVEYSGVNSFPSGTFR